MAFKRFFQALQHLFEMARQLEFHVFVNDGNLIQILEHRFRGGLGASVLEAFGIAKSMIERIAEIDAKGVEAVDHQRRPDVESANTSLV